MTGCPVACACLVACLLGEESQQCVPPHVWHVRRWTQVAPIFTHSSHSRTSGSLTSTMASRWAQDSAVMISPLTIHARRLSTCCLRRPQLRSVSPNPSERRPRQRSPEGSFPSPLERDCFAT